MPSVVTHDDLKILKFVHCKDIMIVRSIFINNDGMLLSVRNSVIITDMNHDECIVDVFLIQFS